MDDAYSSGSAEVEAFAVAGDGNFDGEGDVSVGGCGACGAPSPVAGALAAAAMGETLDTRPANSLVPVDGVVKVTRDPMVTLLISASFTFAVIFSSESSATLNSAPAAG